MNRWIMICAFLLFAGAGLKAQGPQYCQLASTMQIAFGTYSSSALETTGSISIDCTSGVAYYIALNAGTTAGATTTNRMLSCGGCTPKTLGYQLFSNASYTANWGNDTGVDTVSATGTGSTQNFTIWAEVPALEAYYSGSNGSNYTDLVTVTIVCPKCTSISANNQSFNLNVQGTSQGCGISAGNLNFGNYTGTVLNATSTIQVGCSPGTAYNVGLSAGTAPGATVTTRKMTGPSAALLNYGLFSNSGHTVNWGNTVGTDTVVGHANGKTQSLTVYGQIPAGQSVGPGSYVDTITATITY